MLTDCWQVAEEASTKAVIITAIESSDIPRVFQRPVLLIPEVFQWSLSLTQTHVKSKSLDMNFEILLLIGWQQAASQSEARFHNSCQQP